MILKDGHSNYCWHVPCKSCSGVETADAHLHFVTNCKVVRSLNFERGAHFKNSLTADLERITPGNHAFTTTYNPYSNGTVEVLSDRTLESLRPRLRERRLKISLEEISKILSPIILAAKSRVSCLFRFPASPPIEPPKMLPSRNAALRFLGAGRLLFPTRLKYPPGTATRAFAWYQIIPRPGLCQKRLCVSGDQDIRP